MRKILLWIYLNIMPSAETILVIDVPMRSSRDLGRDTFTITPMSGPMHLSWFRPIQCFRISADAMLSHFGWCDIIDNFCTIGRDPLARCYRAFVHIGSCDVIGDFDWMGWNLPIPDMQACIGRFADPTIALPPRKSILVLLRTAKMTNPKSRPHSFTSFPSQQCPKRHFKLV